MVLLSLFNRRAGAEVCFSCQSRGSALRVDAQHRLAAPKAAMIDRDNHLTFSYKKRESPAHWRVSTTAVACRLDPKKRLPYCVCQDVPHCG
jgi:hypothetical protein